MSYTQREVTDILRQAQADGATEIHLKVPNSPRFRVDGVLLPTKWPHLTPQDTRQAAMALGSLARTELAVASITDHAFGLGVSGVGRFRVHLYRQRGTLGIIIHRMNLTIPQLAQLGVPPSVEQILDRQGLTLLGGGVRRHALMAYLVDQFNARLRGYAVTIERPLTYLHRDGMATVAQRDVGIDVPDFATGIRNAVSQSADLLAVGGVPDQATAAAILEAAEAGLNVLVCILATNSESIVPAFLRRFPSTERGDTETRLDEVLLARAYVGDDGTSAFVPAFALAERAREPLTLPRAEALAHLKA